MDPNKVIVKQTVKEFVKNMSVKDQSALLVVHAKLQQGVPVHAIPDLFIRESLVEINEELNTLHMTDMGEKVVFEIRIQEEMRIISLGKVMMKMDEAIGKEVPQEVKQSFEEWEKEAKAAPEPEKQVINIAVWSFQNGDRTLWKYHAIHDESSVAFGDGYGSASAAMAAASQSIEGWMKHLERIDSPEGREEAPTPEEEAVFWRQMFSEFVQKVWDGVGDGKPYDYPDQVSRYAGESKQALDKIWSEVGTGQWRTPDEVVGAVVELHELRQNEIGINANLRAEVVQWKADAGDAAYSLQQINFAEKIIDDRYQANKVTDEEHEFLSKIESHLRWARQKRSGALFMQRLNEYQARYELREDAIKKLENRLEERNSSQQTYLRRLVDIRAAAMTLQDHVFDEWVGQVMGDPATIVGLVQARMDQLKQALEARQKDVVAGANLIRENTDLHNDRTAMHMIVNDLIRARDAGISSEVAGKIIQLRAMVAKWDRERREKAGLPVFPAKQEPSEYAGAEPAHSEVNSAPDEMVIFINGKSHAILLWPWVKALTFEELVGRAAGTYPGWPLNAKDYTVQYTRGRSDKPTGTLVSGQEIAISDGMHFDIVITNKA